MPQNQAEARRATLIDNQYEVLGVRRGAMGAVYIARDTITGRVFAIKQPKGAEDPKIRNRFLEECKAWIKLEYHPHIVQAYLYREIEGTPCLFLQYVEGIKLSDVLSFRRPVFLPQALAWAEQMAEAMSYVHGDGRPGAPCTLHRDLKPANVLISRDLKIKITDFGLAHVVGLTVGLTQTGEFIGTPLYASPEQIERKKTDRRSDIYSFGVILYEILTGFPPYSAHSVEELFHKVLTEPVPQIDCAKLGCSAALSRLVSACLEKKPQERPATFAEILSALREINASVDQGVRPPYLRCEKCGLVLPGSEFPCPFERLLPLYGSQAPEQTFIASSSFVIFAETTTKRLTSSSGRVVPLRFRARPRSLTVGEILTISGALLNCTEEPASVDLYCCGSDLEAFSPVGKENHQRLVLPPGSVQTPGWYAFRLRCRKPGRFSDLRVEAQLEGAGSEAAPIVCGRIPEIEVLQGRSRVLFGRSEELRILQESLQEASSGQTNFVLIEGEAGSGKTALSEEAARKAQQAGYVCLSGSALASDAEPLKPFVDLLREYLNVGQSLLSASELTELLQAHFTGAAAEGFFETFGQVLAGAVEPEALNYSQWYHVLARMLRDCPTVLLLEDFHRASNQSIALLSYLLLRLREAKSPAAFWVTVRNDEPRSDILLKTIEELQQYGDFVRKISLKPFDLKDTTAVIQHFFPGGLEPRGAQAAARAVQRATGGNPFFVLELLKQFVAAGGTAGELIVPEGSGAPSFLNRLPPTVEALLKRRLAALEPLQAEVLTTAALMGDEFDVEILIAVLSGRDRAEIEEALDLLEVEGIVQPVDQTLKRYRFANSLLRVQAEKQGRAMGRRKLAALHRRIAEAWSLAAESPRRSLSRARHLLAAGEPAEGLKELALGIRSFASRGELSADLLRLLREATAALPSAQEVPLPVALELWRHAAEAEKAAGSLRKAQELFEELVRRAEGAGLYETLCEGLLKLGEVFFRLGESTRGERCFREALSRAKKLGHTTLFARALNCMAVAAKNRGDLEASEKLFRQAVSLLRRGKEYDILRKTLLNVANLYRVQGKTSSAKKLFEEVLSSAERVGDSILRVAASAGLGNVLLMEEKFQEAESRYRAALAQDPVDRHWEGIVLKNLGESLTAQGRFSEALAVYNSASFLAAYLGKEKAQAENSIEKARLLVLLGRIKEAEDVLAALSASSAPGVCFLRAFIDLVRGGDKARSVETLQKTVSGLRSAGQPEYAALLGLYGAFLSAETQIESSKDVIRKAAREAREVLGARREVRFLPALLEALLELPGDRTAPARAPSAAYDTLNWIRKNQEPSLPNLLELVLIFRLAHIRGDRELQRKAALLVEELRSQKGWKDFASVVNPIWPTACGLA